MWIQFDNLLLEFRSQFSRNTFTITLFRLQINEFAEKWKKLKIHENQEIWQKKG